MPWGTKTKYQGVVRSRKSEVGVWRREVQGRESASNRGGIWLRKVAVRERCLLRKEVTIWKARHTFKSQAFETDQKAKRTRQWQPTPGWGRNEFQARITTAEPGVKLWHWATWTTGPHTAAAAAEIFPAQATATATFSIILKVYYRCFVVCRQKLINLLIAFELGRGQIFKAGITLDARAEPRLTSWKRSKIHFARRHLLASKCWEGRRACSLFRDQSREVVINSLLVIEWRYRREYPHALTMFCALRFCLPPLLASFHHLYYHS